MWWLDSSLDLNLKKLGILGLVDAFSFYSPKVLLQVNYFYTTNPILNNKPEAVITGCQVLAHGENVGSLNNSSRTRPAQFEKCHEVTFVVNWCCANKNWATHTQTQSNSQLWVRENRMHFFNNMFSTQLNQHYTTLCSLTYHCQLIQRFQSLDLITAFAALQCININWCIGLNCCCFFNEHDSGCYATTLIQLHASLAATWRANNFVTTEKHNTKMNK